MSAVLAVLKFIGILLLAILGLVLVIAALVLFVPVCYQVFGQNRFGMVFSFRIWWLFGLVSVKKTPDAKSVWLKVFGIPVKCLWGREEYEEENIRELEHLGRTQADRPGSEESKGETKKKEIVRAEKTTGENEPEKGRQPHGAAEKNGTEKGDKNRNKKRQKKHKEQGKKSFSFKRVSGIIEFVRNADNIRAFRKVLSELKRLIAYIWPRHICGKILYGTGDPATTGLITGLVSLVPFVYQEDVSVYPDFEEKKFMAEGEMSGRVQIVWFLWRACKIYRDREIRELWEKINRL